MGRCVGLPHNNVRTLNPPYIVDVQCMYVCMAGAHACSLPLPPCAPRSDHISCRVLVAGCFSLQNASWSQTFCVNVADYAGLFPFPSSFGSDSRCWSQCSHNAPANWTPPLPGHCNHSVPPQPPPPAPPLSTNPVRAVVRTQWPAGARGMHDPFCLLAHLQLKDASTRDTSCPRSAFALGTPCLWMPMSTQRSCRTRMPASATPGPTTSSATSPT
jgi:hypothetical protein|eukprot:COSAG01_NODE_3328_length_6249_cov_3.493821_6_plen_215_part_00